TARLDDPPARLAVAAARLVVAAGRHDEPPGRLDEQDTRRDLPPARLLQPVENVIDEPPRERLLRGEDRPARSRLGAALDRLTGVLREELVHDLLELRDLVALRIELLRVLRRAAAELREREPRVRQRVALPLLPGRDEEERRPGGLAHRVGRD